MLKKNREDLLKIDEMNIGKYTLSKDDYGKAKKLGEGGSGIVYQTMQTFVPGVSVKRAIKFFVFKDDLINKLDTYISSLNFEDEIANISKFNHQNVIKVIDGGFYKTSEVEIPYIVSDFVEGKTLEELLDDENAIEKYFSEKEYIFNLFTQILEGLIYLHNRRFFHCDIAPKNIFINLTEEGLHVIIGDLGVGHTISDKLNKEILVTGTKKYMPEDVDKLKDTKISFEQFSRLQPYWDIFSLKASFKECIEKIFKISIKQRTSSNWLNALIFILQKTHRNLSDLANDINRIHPTQRRIADLPELSDTDGDGRLKLIPINDVLLTKRIAKIANHPSLVRLKNVPQLLMGSTIFPGSNHNRYEHLLGTYENMRRVLKGLLQKDKFIALFSKEVLETALISALLANTTRFPFSFAVHELRNSDKRLFERINQKNLFDKILNYKAKTENFKISLFDSIGKHFNIGDFNIIKKIICGDPEGFNNSETQIIYSLLNSSIDVRVLDFLQRDPLHLGLSNGFQFDFDNLISCLDEHNNKIAITSRGVTSVEQVITARYWLYKNIYWNEPNRAYTAMLKQILFILHESNNFNEESFIEDSLFTTPREFLTSFQKITETDPKLKDLINLINSKRTRIFRRIFLINKAEEDSVLSGICDKIGELTFSELDKIRTELEEDVSSVIKFDKEKKINLLIDIPTEDNNKLGKDINVRKYDGSIVKLTAMSGIVNGINNYFDSHLQWLRIYCHPDYKERIKEGENSVKMKKIIKEFLIKKLG